MHEYGLIVLDAFSSDAIPIHLMMTEALGLYLSRLASGGALAFHTRTATWRLHRCSRSSRSATDSRAIVIRVDGDGENLDRSRIAGDRRTLDHAGNSAVNALVDG